MSAAPQTTASPDELAELFTAHPSARAQYEQFVISEATAVCRTLLDRNPRQPALVHLLGLLAHRRGDNALALASQEQAVRLEPANPVYASELAQAYERAGLPTTAAAAYEAALRLAPDDAENRLGLARTLGQTGRLHDAVTACESALELAANARNHCALSEMLLAVGRPVEAFAHYKRARLMAPDSTDVYLSLGRAWLMQKRPWRALAVFRRGLERSPEHAQICVASGLAYLHLMRLDDAVRAFRIALAYAPFDLTATRNLLFALELLQQRDESAGVYTYLGQALERVGRWQEASEAHKEAVARRPDALRSCLGLGWCALQLGEPAEAIEWLVPAVTREPESMETRERLACAFALTGDLRRYWEQATWHARHRESRRFEQPVWDGSPPHGRRILIWSDVSAEETLLLVRFASTLAARGAHVSLECEPRLVPVLEGTGYLQRVIPKGAGLPDFDTHVRLRTLPHVLGSSWADVATSVPCLSGASSVSDPPFHRIDRLTGRNIGLVWAALLPTGQRSQYVPLSAFAALARVGDAHFYSLQQGPEGDERFAPPVGLELDAIIDDHTGLQEIARWLMQLDLVIAVDSVVAHLAAGLGRTVWLLLPPSPDWRWPLEGDTTPWYPTMRLFRRSRSETWAAVAERMAVELTNPA